MEQQYHRISTVSLDVATPEDPEKDGHDIPSEPCQRCQRRQDRYCSKRPWQICFTVTFWILTSIVLGIWLWSQILSPRNVVPPSITEQKTSQKFMPDERFNPWNQTKESDEAWAEMHSRFVMIEAPKSHGLPPSLNGQTEGSQVYAVAVFHQLHCLRIVRGAWYAVLKDGVDILDGPVNLPGHPAYKELSGHVAHCFDYIRQSLMCSGDATMEAFLEADGVTPREQGSSGWGVEHQCVDFDALKRWTEQHKDPGP